MEAATEENEVEINEQGHEEENDSQLFIMDLSSPREKSRRFKFTFHTRFINGLAVGFGMGCVAMFLILWIAIFFTPRLPETTSYQTLLSVFIYPLLYLLTVGLISITAGLVKENSMKED